MSLKCHQFHRCFSWQREALYIVELKARGVSFLDFRAPIEEISQHFGCTLAQRMADVEQVAALLDELQVLLSHLALISLQEALKHLAPEHGEAFRWAGAS